MRRLLLTLAVVALVGLAGCSALSGGADPAATPDGEGVAVADDSPNATAVNQTLRLAVNESTAGSELTAIGAAYPREHFAVDSAPHGNVSVGVDTDADGDVEREFDESDVSGVNTNDYSFEITLDTGYTLEAGDVVVVRYPAVDNPSEPGSYEVALRLNGERVATDEVRIE